MLKDYKKRNTFTQNTQDTLYTQKNQKNIFSIVIIIRCNLTHDVIVCCTLCSVLL